jgi:hypothetical protein
VLALIGTNGTRNSRRVLNEICEQRDGLVGDAAEKTGLISPMTIGLTLRYGIFIRSEFWGERRLVVHELVHTAQYERLGGFRPFLEQYLRECITPARLSLRRIGTGS